MDEEDKKVARVVTFRELHDVDDGNAEYWKTKTPQERLAALEEIRREYHQWKYGAEPRLQKVYRIVELKDLEKE